MDISDVMSICKSTTGDLWLGTVRGLIRYNPESDNFTSIPELSNKNIYHILEDSHGNVWVSTYASGVFRYDIKLKKWKNFHYQANNPNSLPYNKVTNCYEDSQKRLWIMTQGGGFCRYIPENDNFLRYGMPHGFPSNTIYRMEEDNMHQLWLTTNNGLVRFNPETNEKRIYTTMMDYYVISSTISLVSKIKITVSISDVSMVLLLLSLTCLWKILLTLLL